ncbi:uncharacterized protein PF3D7_1120600-like isoform X1 [Daktulosphaira vitifoliae]|uniref:uncharacterized protein PF3D7_1120600-like isoform X1 n=1 Tax=Daktulosphaira vitifoliae TaxID=58002 RepID=UPI0021AA3BF8|nr:uncharacterized protein PF3D7_1120600-like isoform X1 [Daktulosphaira vitifoliae]
MMGHQIFDERNLTSDIQCRKLPEVKEHRALNVIDYFKFAPLQYKCPDNSYLTLFDVFRFMKYNFDSKQLQGYQELVLASTIRPILILVRMYASFSKIFIHFYDCNKNNTNKNLNEIRNNMSEIGTMIIKQIEYFNNLNLFQKRPKTYLDNLSIDICNVFIENKISCNTVHSIMSSTNAFLKKNKLNNYFGIISDITIKCDNVDQIYNEFVQLVNIKSTYLIELEKYKETIYTVNKTRKINFLYFVAICKDLFNPIPTMINRLCSQNIYTEIYNIEDSESVDDKKTTINTLYHDNVNNTKQTNNQNATDSTKNKNPLPSYMIDYILFI